MEERGDALLRRGAETRCAAPTDALAETIAELTQRVQSDPAIRALIARGVTRWRQLAGRWQ